MLTIGLLSGTSVDGIDVALVDCFGDTPRLLANLDYPIPAGIKRRIDAVAVNSQAALSDVMALHGELGELFAEAALALIAQEKLTPENIAAIGSHGQTVFHQPLARPPATLQIGNAAIIATRTGISTVADFRINDMAHGGQGAPLAPLLHSQLFGRQNIAVLNLGGIANLTLLPTTGDILGYDTGPANTLLDSWTQQHRDQPFDNNGEWARAGKVNNTLLAELQNEPYLTLAPPKSTGTDYFSREWLNRKLEKTTTPKPGEVQTTLAEFTAKTIADSLKTTMPDCQQLLVCGGGALNGYLLERLSSLLNFAAISTSERGHDPQWIEGILFGWLAYRRLKGLPGNLPSATGASQHCQLGAIYPAS